ncbi:MAG: hypothetical protein JNL11_15905 [Bdellovibrionaceae bacterium]|nr:hypothetical protein [Pseudobdellovibrionaceae bacterium]
MVRLLVAVDRYQANRKDCNCCKSAFNSLFPNLEEQKILDISRAVSRDALLKALSDEACKPRIKMDNIEVGFKGKSFLGDTTEVFNEIDTQLNRRNILGMAYNAKLLYNKEAKDFGGHMSVVVGRRYNRQNGECEYLIRNSWGRGCSSYDAHYTCEAGNIWMPKSVLAKGIHNVIYIK